MKTAIASLLVISIILLPTFTAAQGLDPGRGPLVTFDASPGIILRRKGTQEKFRNCYKQELKRTPNLAGKISVRFWIATETGTVSMTKVESSLNNERLEKCVVNVIRGLRFPRGRNWEIVYPIVFSEEKK